MSTGRLPEYSPGTRGDYVFAGLLEDDPAPLPGDAFAPPPDKGTALLRPIDTQKSLVSTNFLLLARLRLRRTGQIKRKVLSSERLLLSKCSGSAKVRLEGAKLSCSAPPARVYFRVRSRPSARRSAAAARAVSGSIRLQCSSKCTLSSTQRPIRMRRTRSDRLSENPRSPLAPLWRRRIAPLGGQHAGADGTIGSRGRRGTGQDCSARDYTPCSCRSAWTRWRSRLINR